MRDVINFNIFTSPWIKDTIPLYDDNDDLIGGAAPDPSQGPCFLQCFVASVGHPVSLNLTADLPVYVQLIEDESGYYKSGRITTVPPTKVGQYCFPQNVRYTE